jgi:hypothetical protein
MATLQVHAGDFAKGKGAIIVNSMGFTMTLAWEAGDGFFGKTHTFTKFDIKEISVATEESVKRVGGTVGWGAAGAVLLGPIGLLAGLLLGGKGKDVTFILQFTSGKKMLATTDSKTYTKLAALVF